MYQFRLDTGTAQLVSCVSPYSRVPVLGRSVPTFPRLPQVTLLIAFICVRSSRRIDYGAYSFFEVVTICDLLMILVFYLVHLFRFYRVLTCISWPLSVRGRPGPNVSTMELGHGLGHGCLDPGSSVLSGHLCWPPVGPSSSQPSIRRLWPLWHSSVVCGV